MKAKVIKTPKLWRRKKGGVEQGSFHIYVNNKPINLATQDAEEARRRRVRAMRGQTKFRDDNEGAAARVIAALDGVALDALPEKREVNGAAAQRQQVPPFTPAGLLPPISPSDAAAGSAAEPEIVDAEPIPSTSWTDDVRAAAGSSEATASADAAAPPPSSNVRIADIPMLDSAFVVVSRVAVQLQMLAHALIARKVFKFDLPVLRDPPPKDLNDFVAQQGKPWEPTDPREPGRAMWEKFGRRICPTELPIPDWAAAPILVAAGTLPIQVMNGHKIDPNAQPPAATAATAPPPAPEGTPDARADA